MGSPDPPPSHQSGSFRSTTSRLHGSQATRDLSLCSACQSVRFCCRQHQRRFWPRRPEDPRGHGAARLRPRGSVASVSGSERVRLGKGVRGINMDQCCFFFIYNLYNYRSPSKAFSCVGCGMMPEMLASPAC